MDLARANGSSLAAKSTLAKPRICSAIRSYIRHFPTPGGGSNFRSAGLLILKPHTLSAISSRSTGYMRCETCLLMRVLDQVSDSDQLAGEQQRCPERIPVGSK